MVEKEGKQRNLNRVAADWPPLFSKKLTESDCTPQTLHPDNNKPSSTPREEDIIIKGSEERLNEQKKINLSWKMQINFKCGRGKNGNQRDSTDSQQKQRGENRHLGNMGISQTKLLEANTEKWLTCCLWVLKDISICSVIGPMRC